VQQFWPAGRAQGVGHRGRALGQQRAGRPAGEEAGPTGKGRGQPESGAGGQQQRRNEGPVNGVCSPEKVNEMENGSNGDGFVQKDIPQRRERRDLPLDGGACHRNATVCPKKLTGSSPKT